MQDLFGNESILPPGVDKGRSVRIAVHQYRQLISIYGKTTGKKCKDCKFCISMEAGSKRFKKCQNAKISNSQATDWNGYWTACGRFEA